MRFALLSLLLLGACTQRTVPDHRPDLSTVFYGVVALVGEGGQPYCSGSVTAFGVVTAAHCVEGASTVDVGTYSDMGAGGTVVTSSVPADVLMVDLEHDLALLGFTSRHYVPISSHTPNVGEDVWAAGMPLGFPFVIHKGTVSTTVRAWSGPPTHFFLIDAGTIYGMSGGPVFDHTGYQVGVVSFMLADGRRGGFPHLGGVIPAEDVFRFLTSAGVGGL